MHEYGDSLHQFMKSNQIKTDTYKYILAAVDNILKSEENFRAHLEYLFPPDCFDTDDSGAPNVGLADAFEKCLDRNDLLFSDADFSKHFTKLFHIMPNEADKDRRRERESKGSISSNPPQKP